MDSLEEYGTAATTIRAFYAALGDGQGAIASSFVVPEKRRLPAFSAAGLSGFYGKLAQPIRLLDTAQSDATHYVVHYRYGTATHICDGRATVTTGVRGGRNLIESIRPLNGC